MARQYHFDQAYYRRFYKTPATRVEEAGDIRLRGQFVVSYLQYLNLSVRRVLDIGCGMGRWQHIVKRHYPRADFHGVEISDYLCQRYGWERSSIVDFRSPHRFDLVICQEVLPYLPAKAARKAIANLNRHCRGVLYLQTITREDWSQNCEQAFTDDRVYLRSAAWYRNALKSYFINIGGGLFLSNQSDVVVYELEKADA